MAGYLTSYGKQLNLGYNMETTDLQPKANIFRILLFVGLSIISITIILILTVNEQTIRTLSNFSITSLMLLLGVWLVLIVSDSLSLMSFVRGTGEKLSFLKCVKTVTIRIFFNVITPFTAGGQPVIVYALKSEGISAGKGSSIVITKVLTFAIFYQAGALTAFFVLFNNYRNEPLVALFFGLGGFIYLSIILLLIFSLINQSFLIFFVNISARILSFFKIVKEKKEYKKKAVREAHLARKSFREFFRKHKLYFFQGVLFNAVMYICQVMLLHFVLIAIGVNIDFLQGFILSALILFLVAFMPTPGSVGIGDLVFVVILKGVVETYMLGIALIIWRFFYQYLGAIIGIVSSSQIMSRMISRIKKKKKAEENAA